MATKKLSLNSTKLHSWFRGVQIISMLLILQTVCAQTTEQKALEEKRERLQKEIKNINRLLFAEKKEAGSVLDQMEALDKKINVRQQLIRVTNQQSNLLNRQINTNIRNIGILRDELERTRDAYAKMLRKSYQNKSKQNRLMFLLSSESFFQAYKRMQYMKQYTDYRKQQGREIVAKTEDLSRLNSDLNEERKVKEVLLIQNRKAKDLLYKEIQSQKILLGTIRKNERKYTATIKKKKKETRKIDQQIEKLIRLAIAASNKKAGGTKKSSSTFVLTPEAKVIAKDFLANKGKLIWPVVKGLKSQGFGIYKDAVYPGIKHQSNGVVIATDVGTKARAIFKGEVIGILSVPGGNKGVQIKHGNFISTYYNLETLFVKKGDIVASKDALGTICTDKSSGQTKLKFYLYQNTSKLNPEDWVYQL